ncbi:MAG: M43 family zinc metalloprotease [Saprospiraceae bacterium]|nr:M43 family zinc metalloprotease [Saprospiraceae bacterium]
MSFFINNREFESKEDFIKWGRGCATKIPTPSDILRIDEEIKSSRARAKRFTSLAINVKFIHITDGNKGHVTRRQREEQINVLNNALKGVKLKFQYKEEEVKFENNKSWYYMSHNSPEERHAKSKLSFDSFKYLNFYTGGLGKGLLGWATFPYDLAGDPVMDGVVLLDESLPYGNASPYNLGMTGVHEVCHWLGLFHTFQGGCNGIGDHVADTVSHKGPNYGKPTLGLPHNACDKLKNAPIQNYMNYVDDIWMKNLTIQQEKRIQDHILLYRTEL